MDEECLEITPLNLSIGAEVEIGSDGYEKKAVHNVFGPPYKSEY